MFVASAGRGDGERFRRGGTNVRQGVMALVAIGDGADAEHVHGTCRSSSRGGLRPDGGGRTGRRSMAIAIAIIIFIATRGRARSR